jgi:hypothetical protein
MVQDGVIDAEYMLTCALKYMSEDDVRDMLEANELIDDEDDGQPTWEQEWEDFGESGYDMEYV